MVAWFLSLPLYALQSGASEAQASFALVVAIVLGISLALAFKDDVHSLVSEIRKVAKK